MLRHFVAISFLATIWGALAAPMPQQELSTPQVVGAAVAPTGQLCGTYPRDLVDFNSCSSKPTVYMQGDPTKPDIVTRTLSTLPRGTVANCDHVVELQILAKVLEKSKFCDVLTAFLAYDPKGSKADTVQEIAQLVSAVENLNYLEKKVNLNKGVAVKALLNDPPQPPSNDPLTQAALRYMNIPAVKAGALSAATAIDAELARIINDAEVLLSKQPVPNNPKSRNAKDVKYFNLYNALEEYKDKKVTVDDKLKIILQAASQH